MDINLVLLGLAHFLALAVLFANTAIYDFVGEKFLPKNLIGLVTLPLGVFIASSGLVFAPAGLIMNKIGYKKMFIIGTVIGLMGSLICIGSFFASGMWSFGLYVLGQVPQGFAFGIVQYYRHVASLMGGSSEGKKSLAIAIVISSGALGGIVGPELDSLSEYWIPGYQYLAAYIWVSAFYVVQFIIVIFVDIKKMALDDKTKTPRSLLEIISTHEYAYAMTTSSIVNVLKSMFTAITPLVLIDVGIELFYVSFLLEFHIFCQYIPSFFTSKLIGKFGASTVSLVGTIMTALGACIYIIDDGNPWHKFWIVAVAMALIGVGWNLTFVCGTTMLSSSYRLEEKYKAQSFNDTCMFGFGAILTMLSGTLLNAEGLTYFLVGIIITYVLVVAMHVSYIIWKCKTTIPDLPAIIRDHDVEKYSVCELDQSSVALRKSGK